MKRIGLFGGSFDPVHNAHLALARCALAELALDELRWVPAGQPWQKARELAAPEHRAEMVRLAIDGEPRFVLDRCELERGGPTYTLDTVRALQGARTNEQWLLIVGADQLAGFPTWHGWRELLSRVSLAVAQRPGASLQRPAELGSLPFVSLTLPMMDVSSTMIRARIARDEEITDLVPAAVARYIDQHHLYRGNPRS